MTLPRLHVLVPALNEALNLPALFAELVPALQALQVPWRLLVVDDGSTDETVALVRKLGAGLPVEVVSHETNRGPGAAFLTGFRWLLAEADPEDGLLTLEADTTCDLGLLPRMLAGLEGGAEVVLASVYHPEGGLKHTPLHRRLLSLGANTLMQLAFQLRGVHTFSSFYRLYRVKVLRQALQTYGDDLMREPGFAAVVELLVKLERQGARLAEVPMTLDSARRKGSSRLRIGRTVKAYGRLLWRLGLKR